MKLSDYLKREMVEIITAKTKWDAINQTLELCRGDERVKDHATLAVAIREREKVMATGIGVGIGVPHIRHTTVTAPLAALTLLAEPVPYGSLDGIPVKVLLLIAMPDGAQQDYLKYLAKAVNFFSKPAMRETLFQCETVGELWEAVRDR